MTQSQLLEELIKDPNDKLICIDMDGTLCEGESWGHGYNKPFKDRIEWCNENLYNRGGHIVIYTARFPELYAKTAAWLTKYGMRYHGIAMGKKPGADYYLDDKCININDIFNN